MVGCRKRKSTNSSELRKQEGYDKRFFFQTSVATALLFFTKARNDRFPRLLYSGGRHRYFENSPSSSGSDLRMTYGFVCAPADNDRKKTNVESEFALLHIVANRKRKTGSGNDALTQIWRNIPEIFLLVQLFLIDKRRIQTRRNTPNCTRCIKESKKIVPQL